YVSSVPPTLHPLKAPPPHEQGTSQCPRTLAQPARYPFSATRSIPAKGLPINLIVYQLLQRQCHYCSFDRRSADTAWRLPLKNCIDVCFC
ncbi:hypothetical protein J6590_105687, partial [Homalodisca vitripennis]